MSGPDDRDDPRLRSAWRTWLSALAVDAEAAVAAALAYEALAAEGRDAWLDALDDDRDKLDVPAGATAAYVGFNIHANTIGKATFTALYGR